MNVLVATDPCQHSVSVLDFKCSNRCVVLSHCCFISYFSNDRWYSKYFHTLFAPFISSLMRCLFNYFVYFLFGWLICSIVKFYILFLHFITSHYWYLFCKYVLLVCGLSFHSLNGVFHRAGGLNFNKLQLIFFSFMDHIFTVLCKNSSWNPGAPKLAPSLLLKVYSFMFTFKFIIYLELFFVKSVRSLSKFIFWPVNFQCSRTTCWKHYPFPIDLTSLLCQRSVDDISVSLFLGALFCFFDQSVYYFTITTLSWLLKFIVSLAVK